MRAGGVSLGSRARDSLQAAVEAPGSLFSSSGSPTDRLLRLVFGEEARVTDRRFFSAFHFEELVVG